MGFNIPLKRRVIFYYVVMLYILYLTIFYVILFTIVLYVNITVFIICFIFHFILQYMLCAVRIQIHFSSPGVPTTFATTIVVLLLCHRVLEEFPEQKGPKDSKTLYVRDVFLLVNQVWMGLPMNINFLLAFLQNI